MAIQTVCLLRTVDARPSAIRKALEAAGIRVVGILEVSKEEVRPDDLGETRESAADEPVKGPSAEEPAPSPPPV